MTIMKKVVFTAFAAFFLSVFTQVNLRADEVGNTTCGKPFIVRGSIRHARIGVKVENATESDMYSEEIYGSNFSALVEGLPEGNYKVEIYLAETYVKEKGKRVFNITYEDKVLAEALDLFAEVGFAKEHVIKADVFHRSDNINGPLTIGFATKVNYAKLNAIIIKDTEDNVLACVKAKDLRSQDDIRASVLPKVDTPVIYTDPAQPVEKRVSDLVKRMSLLEKVGQLRNSASEIPRLGVPAYDYWNECLHGIARAGKATVFPQAIGMAAMWDTEMMHTIADTIAVEGRAKNNKARQKDPNTARYYGLTFWTPNINIFRDPRWGRGHETYGEDPYLTGTLGVQFIKGLQGDDPKYYKSLACAKHFAVHSGPEKLRHVFDAVVSERDLYETYLPQFEMAVKEGKVGNVMSVYNKIYGIPGPANKRFLTEILRNQWGFDGHVVSDCGGIYDVWRNHKYVKTPEEASAISVLAGNDLNCGSTYRHLTKAVFQGHLTEADIDKALTRVLTARFRLGLFDTPKECPYLNIPVTDYDTPKHDKLALEAAHKSIVLLKNKRILPLDKTKLKRVAVIGPNAAETDVLHGNYNGTPSNPVSVLEGIRNELGDAVEVTHAKGCPIAIYPDDVYTPENKEAKEAVALAKEADVVIFVGGLDAEHEGEEMWRIKNQKVGFDKGDRTLIELPEQQTTLLKALKKVNKRIVFVNLSSTLR